MSGEVLPQRWAEFIRRCAGELAVAAPLERLERRRSEHAVYPPEGRVFRAFELTPPECVRVVIVGQDPYHNPGEAEGPKLHEKTRTG